MATGLAVTTLANKWLDMLRAVAFTAPAGTFIKLHTADPGAAATTAPSAVTTRQSATFSAAASGAIALSNTPAFAMTASETISHISVWDASTAGNVLFTGALTTARVVVNTDTLTFNTLGVSLAPVMA
jgi:flagellar capping protein FliD